MRITTTNVIAMAATMITVLMMAAPSAVAAEPGSGKARANAETASPGGTQPPRSSRLRFRSGGPVCMCVNGLSEEEISAAERRRKEADAAAGQQIINQEP